ncbi:MAG: hypothetical protein AB1454_00040 [Candidatus Auribacterota bacterium]
MKFYTKEQKPIKREYKTFNIFVKGSLDSLADIEKTISDLRLDGDLERIILVDNS